MWNLSLSFLKAEEANPLRDFFRGDEFSAIVYLERTKRVPQTRSAEADFMKVSLRFQSIILRVLRLDISVWIS
jgi:hypothetical protein